MREKLNKIAVSFSIKDMENLSGIKAETIRVWESRYQILEPERTSTNIRTYDINALQKLLNVSTLVQSGHKISKLAKWSDESLRKMVLSHNALDDEKGGYVNELCVAMIGFNNVHFYQLLDQVITKFGFEDAFVKLLIPLMDRIGVLWQTKTILPAHEHFASNLVKQRLHSEIERARFEFKVTKKTQFILFLPMNEIHEIGLLYLNYLLIKNGFESIYLGQSIPISNVKAFEQNGKSKVYVTSATVSPRKESLPEYVKAFFEIVQLGKKDKLWITGRNSKGFDVDKVKGKCKVIDDFNSVLLRLSKIESPSEGKRIA